MEKSSRISGRIERIDLNPLHQRPISAHPANHEEVAHGADPREELASALTHGRRPHRIHITSAL